ncbi:alpha/beta hydrolase [Hyphomicrobium sp.]|jgi:pimeloyl-ACP methyl ester carboxylesterase|uniref:alpha/beta hydrolase n=1 Tax=Hyphomicrobium sp. TaxID=82 RepID=UPI0035670E1C
MASSYKIPSSEPQLLPVGTGAEARNVAFVAHPAGNPGIFWLPGFMSDMGSTKATAVAAWAAARGLSSTLFDYSGHGRSSGAIETGTIGRWLEEAEAIFTKLTQGPQIIIGSSMGGYISLLLLRKLLRDRPQDAARIKALLLIAPAWDMTEELMWKRFPDDTRHAIMADGFFRQPSAYASPYMITRQLIEEGREHLLARKPFDPGRPVVILQGLQDADVPASHTQELKTFLTGDKVKLIEIADGEHRLSRPQDLYLLFSELAALL